MKKKVLFIIPGLGFGGGEKTLLLLLRHIDRDMFEPSVAVFHSLNDFKDEMPGDVRITSLERRSEHDNIGLMLRMSRLIKKTSPHVICTMNYRTNYLSFMARGFSRVKAPLVFIEASNLSLDIREGRFERVKKFLVRNIYHRVSSVVSVSRGVKDDLVENWGLPPEKAEVIYSPVETDEVKTLAKEDAGHPWFSTHPVLVACGRLVPQKNHKLLIKAFKGVADAFPEARLMIIGNGELLPMLTGLAMDLGILEKVAFMGFQRNPYKFIARSRALVMSSLWEGFPLTLIDAMAVGAPVISTRCPSGPEELITDGVNGILVPVDDEKGLSMAMLKVLRDRGLRERLSIKGVERATDFDVRKVTAEYERLFERAYALYHAAGTV